MKSSETWSRNDTLESMYWSLGVELFSTSG